MAGEYRRPEGYYWVRQNENSAPDIAQYVNPHHLRGHFYLPGLETPFNEADLIIMIDDPIEPPR
jgi:hypothetical protein